MRDVWRWPVAPAAAVSGTFLLIDLAFFGANLLKIEEGGWIPLVMGALIFAVMTSWRRGVDALRLKQTQMEHTPAWFHNMLREGNVARVPGTAVFFSRGEEVIPQMMVRHVEQFKALQETVVSMTVNFETTPRVPLSRRAVVEGLPNNLWRITVQFGFIELPNVVAALECAKQSGCPLDLHDAVYFAAHDEVVRSKIKPRLAGWRRMLFAFMYRNAVRPPDRFDLPADRFLEVGRQVAL
jgi:KUP system potassium uptake protein